MTVQPTEIVLKQECDFLVKQEQERGEIVCSREIIKTIKPTDCSSCDEKQITINTLQTEKRDLISMLSIQKEENQHLMNELEEAKQRSEKLLTETLDLKTEKMNVITMLSALKEDNHYLTTKLEDVNQKSKQTSNENIELKSKVEQLNSQINGEFEVEKLLKHKKSKGEQCFLVRWKGYSSEHDCWVPQKNLMCPDILEDYKKEHDLI